MIQNPHKTSFVVFEGIDMSGKSTQFARLQRALMACHQDVPVIYTKEPDASRPIGKEIYNILNGKSDHHQISKMQPFHMQTFYIEDRMNNYRDNIIPALQNGKHVLQDRGIASSLCYGSDGPEEFYDFMGMHKRIFSAGLVPFFWPDAIVIVDVPAEVAVERGRKAGKTLDVFENPEKLARVRTNYLAFANMYPNCFIVDGTQEEIEVAKQIQSKVFPIMGINKTPSI